MDSTLPDGASAMQIEYQTRNDNQSDEINNNDDSVIEELAFCPYCEQEVTVEGIYCVECESWLHYECVNLNPETVSDTFKDTEYVCDQCNEDTLYGDSQPNTQDHVSEQGGNDVTTDRDTSPDSQATGVSNEWSKPSAMSGTGTTQKTSHLSSIPNLSPSKSQADLIFQSENTITLDKDPNPHEVPPVGISQTSYATNENQVKSKEPPVRLTVINPSQSPKPRRPLYRKPNRVDKSKSDVSSPSDVAIILAQKTKILGLENEIKQLKNAFESVKSHLSQGAVQSSNPVNPQPTSTTPNICPAPQTDSYILQQIRHDQHEGRLRMLEHQVVQNMCISTAVNAQLALQVNMSQQKVRENNPHGPFQTGVGSPIHTPVQTPYNQNIYPFMQGFPPYMGTHMVTPSSYSQPSSLYLLQCI